MRIFSFKPALDVRGREFRGLTGFAGKPSHPPLTDVPIGAYVLAAGFDVISFLAGAQDWARDLYRAATFLLVAGFVVSLATVATGLADWLKSTEKGTQVRRTANAHAWTMVLVTLLVVASLALRWFGYWDAEATPLVVLVVTAAAATVTFVGAAIGGALVYDFGFNVENSTDHPAYHPSERDIRPKD